MRKWFKNKLSSEKQLCLILVNSFSDFQQLLQTNVQYSQYKIHGVCLSTEFFPTVLKKDDLVKGLGPNVTLAYLPVTL